MSYVRVAIYLLNMGFDITWIRYADMNCQPYSYVYMSKTSIIHDISMRIYIYDQDIGSAQNLPLRKTHSIYST